MLGPCGLELEVAWYRLFTDEAKVEKPDISSSKAESERGMRQDSKLRPFAKVLSRMNDKDQRFLLHMASQMANRA